MTVLRGNDRIEEGRGEEDDPPSFFAPRERKNGMKKVSWTSIICSTPFQRFEPPLYLYVRRVKRYLGFE